MSLSTLPLSYCTNVHPGRSLSAVIEGLQAFASPIAQEFNAPLAVGLWFADLVSRELSSSEDAVARLNDELVRRQLSCHTLNAFPFGDFHSESVKERVYLPDWSSDERMEYTLRCARILSQLIPEGREGSVSTLPLGYKPANRSSDFVDACIEKIMALAQHLDDLHSETGRIVRLAIEPEPFCLLETTTEVLDFFDRLRARGDQTGLRDAVDQHIGLCYDVCHQAVEFEDESESISALREAEIRINKVQISCAIELARPRDNAKGRAALAHFAEPRYLHQTFAKRTDGAILKIPDLTAEFCHHPPAEFEEAEFWRVHFHVPVNETSLGPLATTRQNLEKALDAIAKLDYAPHLEVETYTWNVLPGNQSVSIVDGIAAELRATRQLLGNLRLKQ